MKNQLIPIFITQIKQILEAARQNAYKAINTEMVNAYWHVGKRIVEEEQNGQERATYGKQLLKTLSEELTASFGKGFTERSLREYRQFYLLFDDFEIRRTLYAKLSWSHFQRILRVTELKARNYYLKEAAENQWSVRTLDRNISTLYYDRLLLSQIEEPVKTEMLEKTATHVKLDTLLLLNLAMCFNFNIRVAKAVPFALQNVQL